MNCTFEQTVVKQVTEAAAQPTIQPTEVPAARPTTIPDVWEMPNQGSGWCDCGEDHPVDRELVRYMITRHTSGCVMDSRSLAPRPSARPISSS